MGQLPVGKLRIKLFRDSVLNSCRELIDKTAHPPSADHLVEDPKPFSYDSLSDFEKAWFHRKMLQRFSVSRKKARLAMIKAMPDLRRQHMNSPG